jgi:hypothetical protein
MTAPDAALIELLLVFGAVLAFGFWELYSLRRDRKRSEAAREQTPPAGGDGE